MSFRTRFLPMLVALLGLRSILAAQDLPLAEGDRLVFLGDSITAANKWAHYVTSYLHLMNPKLKLHIQTEGRGGTALAESSVNPPSIAPATSTPTGERYPKRVAPYRPKYVFVMHGHNGGLNATDYKADYEWLINQHIVGQSGAKPILVGSHPQSTPDGKTILGAYATKIIEIANAGGYRYSDTWNALLPIYTKAENKVLLEYPGTQSAPETHPGTAGHILIAYQVIKNLGFSTLVSSATIDAAAESLSASDKCVVTGVSANGYYGVDFTRLDERLPWAIDEHDPNDGYSQALQMNPQLSGWQKYMLTVRGLEAGDYDVWIDGVKVATLASTVLSNGWNMADLKTGPIYAQVQEVLGRIRDMHGVDRTTLESTSPNRGVVRYVSGARVSYEVQGNRGAAHEAALSAQLAEISSLDALVHAAAEPVGRKFSIRLKKPAPYVPPLGIPAPSFGINERHTDFVNAQYNFGAGPVAYPDAGNGPYTHYVDKTHPQATDTGNIYGTPSKPRLTIPEALAPGSVVEIHGSGYALNFQANSVARTSGVVGTKDAPIYIRGTNPKVRPIITTTDLDTYGLAYLIIENLDFDMSNAVDGLHFNQNCHHNAVRNCLFRNTRADYGRDVAYHQSNTRWQPGDTIEDIVWIRNVFGPNGEYPPTFESGIQGLGLKNSTIRCWVLENKFYRNAEDGIHIFGGSRGDDYANFVYIGANEFEDCGENGIDVKQSHDIIISSNVFRKFRRTHWPVSGANGEAIVLNNDSPNDRLWVINNLITDSTTGVRSQSSGRCYVIGNVFRDIVHEIDQTPPTTPGVSAGVAVTASSFESFHVVNNTFYNVDGGYYVPNGFATIIQNNIFGPLKEATTFHLRLGSTDNLSFDIKNNYYAAPRRFSSTKAVETLFTEGDVKFVNAAGNQFMLQPDSPAKDAGGVPEAYSVFFNLYHINIAVDIRGEVRPQGAGWDIGAYEISGAPPVRPSAPKNLRIVSP